MGESLAFKDWAKGEGLVLGGPLNDFNGTTVAFDAEDYLNALLTNTQTREPLLPALGGLPFALRQHVDQDLEHLQEAGIKPIFVFNGLEIACKDRKSINKESQKAVSTLDEAWRVYDLGQGDSAVVAFGKACKLACAVLLDLLADGTRHIPDRAHCQVPALPPASQRSPR